MKLKAFFFFLKPNTDKTPVLIKKQHSKIASAKVYSKKVESASQNIKIEKKERKFYINIAS